MRERPVLVYDGDCAFCTSSVLAIERVLRPDAELSPWQFTDLDALGVRQQRAEHEVLWVTPTGQVHGGAQAFAKLLLHRGGPWAVPGALLRVPPVRWAAAGVYRLIADHRDKMPGGTPACAMPAAQRPTGRG